MTLDGDDLDEIAGMELRAEFGLDESPASEAEFAELAAVELVQSLAPENRASAAEILEKLLVWTSRRSAVLDFHYPKFVYPAVRFDSASGDAFWIARATVGAGAKIEILTRTIGTLTPATQAQLACLLGDLVESEVWDGARVAQVQFAKLADRGALTALFEALDFALGAVVERGV